METIKHLTYSERILESLSDRQREIFILYGEGKSPEEIGKILFISKKTVWSHKVYSLEKLGITNHQYMYLAIRYHVIENEKNI